MHRRNGHEENKLNMHENVDLDEGLLHATTLQSHPF